MNLGTTILRGRPRIRWQDEVREDGRIVGGEGWQEKVHSREEWKKLLRTARNRRILHTPMELMNEKKSYFTNVAKELRCIHQRNDFDRTILICCPIRAWIRLRCLGVRERWWLCSVTFTAFSLQALLIKVKVKVKRSCY